MKTNELSLQELQQTNGGSAMPPMPENSGAGDLTIMQAPQDPATGPDGSAGDGTVSTLDPSVFGAPKP